ncbi:type I pullulanase [Parabacteroides sp. AF17-3]|uniref:type I pullulanase n=1 Tax=Parabacteroides sp. AF17-3 TaxID=2293113 RepID=UPI000EFFA104|nr:type I pullulanase [Parabacteroides sp. AF17-3]RKU69476.1 type I pullulanase [Parabacteroides sp. AF17-3]
METLTDHPSTERLDSYDKYPSYYGSDLELVYTPEQSVFTLWAPSADRVRLNLYASGEGGDPEEHVEMEKAGYGTWRIHIDRDLKGSFYTFQIEKNGKWLNETPGIWAKAVGINGNRAAVIDWNETNPEGWESDRSPELKMYSDIILYELHHRDFSIAPDSGIENKGKFLALTETGTKTPEGEATGLDHLKELGVTHIHILPSFDFATVDETRLDENRYNWGYDPKNYNVPDGSYSTDPANPVVRIREFKEMVKSLHQNGFRIVLDVVYNHTASTDHSNFDLTVPGYFYRQNADGSYSNASGCGNETASEREMVRHYIIESVKFWAREYHIDGFRFDLMGIHDIETMNRLRSELLEIDPTIFVYGEGWVAADSPLPFEQRAVKENVEQMEGIGVFNDEFRDGLKGSTFDEQEPGYASGNINGHFEPVKYGIVGGTDHPQVDYGGLLYCNAPYAGAPSQMINFVSCHDGYTLVDKLKLSVQGDHAADELIPIDKLVHTVLLTAQGIPFIRSGEEIMQDKQGEPNSYKSPDSINRIDWSLKAKNREVFDFIRGLIALRKAHPAFRIPTVEGLQQWLRFMDTGDSGVIAYTLGEYANNDEWKEILVAYNGNRHEVEIGIPEGEWNVVCRNGQIDPEGKDRLPGGSVKIAASSALILYRQ